MVVRYMAQKKSGMLEMKRRLAFRGGYLLLLVVIKTIMHFNGRQI